MKILALTYLDPNDRPKIVLKLPEKHQDVFLEVPPIKNIDGDGFFMYEDDNFKSANLTFDVYRRGAQGDCEVFLISLFLIKESNPVLFKEVLRDFVIEFKKIPNVCSGIHKSNEKSAKIKEILTNCFQNLPTDIDKYFFQGRTHVRKISDSTIENLFIEVSQQELRDKLFIPLSRLMDGLHKYKSHFFPMRFAILGDFKIGKTELGQYIIYKLDNCFENCISLTINSRKVEYLSEKDIDDWVYNQWYMQIMHIEKDDFKKVVKKEISNFQKDRGYHPDNIKKENYEDKLYLICKIYKSYLKIDKNAKFVVQFDQANVLTNEKQFAPFYEFWRNFQGYWEQSKYFSKLPIFIFVMGHKDWEQFAALKDDVGRGVFDDYVHYKYWDTSDISLMFEKRLEFAIRPTYYRDLIKYFLCPGIVDHFGKKLGEANTQKYLDTFFGDYFQKFLMNFENNRLNYTNFLDYCKRVSVQEKREETYFHDVERIFCGVPALDYMPVFRYLNENKNEKWFNDIFKLIEALYEENYIPFNSRGLKDFKNLAYKFLDYNFTYSPLSGSEPEYNPPLFHDYSEKLALDRSFKSCLDTIPTPGKQGPVFRLKRFVRSKRVERNVFNEDRDGGDMKQILGFLTKKSNQLFNITQKWAINQFIGIIDDEITLTEDNLIPFIKIRDSIIKINDLYRGNDTNWANFDKEGRDLSNILVQELFPKDSFVISNIDIEHLKDIRSYIESPKTSNITMAKHLDEMLSNILAQMETYDDLMIKKTSKHDSILEFEKLLRVFLQETLYKVYKDDWWIKGIPEEFRKEAERRMLKKKRKEPTRLYEPIDFLEFSSYASIITYKKNWSLIFEKIFESKQEIQIFLGKLNEIRNDIAHARFNKDDLNKIDLYIDEIAKFIPEFYK